MSFYIKFGHILKKKTLSRIYGMLGIMVLDYNADETK